VSKTASRVVIAERGKGDKAVYHVFIQTRWLLFWQTRRNVGMFLSLPQACASVSRAILELQASQGKGRLSRQQRRQIARDWAKVQM